MDIFLLVSRLVLTGVFGVAGIAKAFDPQGSMKAFADFGVPAPLRRPLTYLLPAFEIGVAVSLLFVQISWYGAIGAAVLLLIFISGMLYQFAKGNAPDCHCFGQIHSEPVGVSSIVRNIVLLIPAGVLSVQGMQLQGYSISNTPQEILTLSVGIVLAGLALIALLYLRTLTEQQRRLMRQLEIMELVDRHDEIVEREDIGHPREGLPLGALVPDFEAKDLAGKKVTLSDIRADGLPVVFIFVGATCTICEALLYDFPEWETEFAGKIKFVYITEGDVEVNRKKFQHPGRTVLLQDIRTRDLSVLFRAKWTPMAVLMNRKGRIASFTGAGDVGLRELVGKIDADALERDHTFYVGRETQTLTKIRIGEEMRPFVVKDINGNEINSNDLQGKQTMFAFWSPTCKYCGPMLEEIKAWDATKNGVDPELILFADGESFEEYKEFGLSSPVVWDPDHRIGNSIGQFGTPSAIMIDENGRFITETAVGSEDIWALIGKVPKVDG